MTKKTTNMTKKTTNTTPNHTFRWSHKILIMALLLRFFNPLLNFVILGPGSSSWPFTLLADTPPNPSSTSPASFPVDVVDYRGFQFVPASTDYITHLSLGYIAQLIGWMPRWALHMMNRAIILFGDETNVTIHDARGENLSFHETGFKLHKMSHPSAVTNWRSHTDIKTFQAEMEPVLRDLVPGAKRIKWTYEVVRGGSGINDEAVLVNSVHLDYTQNDTARERFYDQYPTNGHFLKELPALLGDEDTDTEKLAVILGVWKPINMESPVCDHPLAIMDARTFSPDDERALGVHAGVIHFASEAIGYIIDMLHVMVGQIVHRASQRWYYYSSQETDEVLVFTHYTRGTHFATPHSSFTNPHCTRGMQTRQSVEMRAVVFV